MSGRKLLFLMKPEQALQFAQLLEAGESGDGAAACQLGDMYREGLGGLRYSPRQAFLWYSRAALAGDPEGQNNLGACYEHGVGCQQSYAKAVKWYRLAAAKQLGTAAMNLGYCFLRGKGIPADRAEALRLFRLAARRGEKKAAAELERLEEPVEEPHGSVHFEDVTESGLHIGIVGVAGPLTRPGDNPRQGTVRRTAEDVLSMIDTSTYEPGSLELAIAIAVTVHAGHKDKGGAPYILHPLRVMLSRQDREEQIAAILHDVVEDSSVTLDWLREQGFAETVVAAVGALTRREPETYDEFVLRAAENPLARRVKLADLRDNSDPSRIPRPTPADLERLERYRKAIAYIEALDGTAGTVKEAEVPVMKAVDQ